MLELKHISHSYGENRVLEDISLTVQPGTGDNGVGSLCEGGPTALAAIPLFTVLIYAEFDDPVTVTFPTLGYLFLRLTKGLAGHTQHIQQRVRNFSDFCIAQILRSF